MKHFTLDYGLRVNNFFLNFDKINSILFTNTFQLIKFAMKKQLNFNFNLEIIILTQLLT